MDTIQVGLIGYDLAGSVFHAPLIGAVPALHFSAVVTSRVDLVKKDLPGVRVVSRAEDLFLDPSIELIVVASPNTTHFDLTRAALAAGKHLVVDKPFTTTSREADALIEQAKSQRRWLSVFQNRRWDNDFRTVEMCIRRGWLGEVHYYETHFDRFRPEIKEG